MARIIDLEETTFSDQTGKFPCVSSRGNKYLMTVYYYDANAIILQPMKNRTGPELTKIVSSIRPTPKKSCRKSNTDYGAD